MFYIYSNVLKIISDINECAMDDDDCSANAHCTNTPGSFDCTCDQGYSGNGVTCIGKWCEMHIGGANQRLGTFIYFLNSGLLFWCLQ